MSELTQNESVKIVKAEKMEGLPTSTAPDVPSRQPQIKETSGQSNLVKFNLLDF